MEWKVAPSYKYATIIKVDEDSHKAYISETCDRCGGSGIIASRVENGRIIPIPVDGGVCYKCGGEGKISKWVKAYTEKEYERYVKSQEKAKEKRVKKEEARIAELDAKSEENKAAVLEKLGFESDIVYLVTGNTFEIKDELKERGARFNPALNWHFLKKTEVPEGHELVEVKIDDLYDWYPRVKRLELKADAREIAAAARRSVEPESKSEWVGEIKERLRNLKVTLTGARAVESMYGSSILFTFAQDDNIFTWFTSCPPDSDKAIVGHSYLLTGTVKKFTEYNGTKQTQLNRCILKEI